MSNIRIVGLKRFQKSMAILGESFEEAAGQGVFLTAHEVRTEAVKGIQKQSSGRIVQRQKQGGKGTYSHVAAAVGLTPNTDTGTLVSSVQVEKIDALTYRVGASAKAYYASWLENGTKKMGARPWLQPAMEEKRENLKDNIRKTIRMAIKRIAK